MPQPVACKSRLAPRLFHKLYIIEVLKVPASGQKPDFMLLGEIVTKRVYVRNVHLFSFQLKPSLIFWSFTTSFGIMNPSELPHCFALTFTLVAISYIDITKHISVLWHCCCGLLSGLITARCYHMASQKHRTFLACSSLRSYSFWPVTISELCCMNFML
jgi:hypothetical protein